MDYRRVGSIVFFLLALGLVVGASGATEVPVADGTTFNATSGPTVTQSTGSTITIAVGSDNIDANTVNWGFMSFQSDSQTNVSVTKSSGTFIEYEQLDVANTKLTLTYTGRKKVGVEGEADTIDRGIISADDGQADVRWSGTTGNTTIYIHSLIPNAAYKLVDEQGSVFDSTLTTGGGVAKFESLPNSEHTAFLQSGNRPQLTNAKPTGYDKDGTVNLSVSVADDDFPADNVNVSFYLNGNFVSNTTVGSQQRVYSGDATLAPGKNTWWATAEDDIGLTDRTSNQSIATGGIITVRNQTDNTVITATNVSGKFYTNDGTETREDNNGNLSMTGFADQSLRVDIDASGYTQRSFNLPTPGQNYTVYLSPDGTSTVGVNFTLNDLTGNYPLEETTLIVQGEINNQWSEIGSKLFGSNNLASFDLQAGEQYRLKVRNSRGDTRILTIYEPPAGGETRELTITSTQDVTPGPEGYSCDADFITFAGNETKKSIRFTYSDPTNSTTDLQLKITELGNESNVLTNQFFSGPHGDLTVTIQNSTTNQSIDKTWVVLATADRDGGDVRCQDTIGGSGISILTNLSEWVGLWLWVILMLVTGMLWSQSNNTIGAVVIPILGGIGLYLGFLPQNVTSGVLIVGAIFVAVLARAKDSVRP